MKRPVNSEYGLPVPWARATYSGPGLTPHPIEDLGHLRQSLFPTDGLPLPGATRSSASHGVDDAIGMIELLRRRPALGTDVPTTDRTLRVTGHADDTAGVIQMHQHLADAMAPST